MPDVRSASVSAPSSTIANVCWARRRAAPGGTVGLDVQTRSCDDGTPIQITLMDAQRTIYRTLSDTLVDNHIALHLQIPEQAREHLAAKVTLPDEGCSAADALELLPPIDLRSPRWSTTTVQRGEDVTLTAQAPGVPDNRTALVHVFERNFIGESAPIDRLTPRVEDEEVRITYPFRYPNDTASIPTKRDARDGYIPPQFFFQVDVGGIRADSRHSRRGGLLTFVDDITIQVVDTDHEWPYSNEPVTFTTATGTTRTVTLDGAGTATLGKVPPGPVRLTLPESALPAAHPAPCPDEAKEATASPAPNSPSTVTISTGSTWRVFAPPSPEAANL